MRQLVDSDKLNAGIEPFLISPNVSIKESMRQMSKASGKILFVVDEDQRLLGSLTDGDIRRWVLREGALSAPVREVFNAAPVFISKPYRIEDVKRTMLELQIEWIPVLSKEGRVLEVLLWKHVFDNGIVKQKGHLDLPVLIMAGGKGTRLDPFTRIFPKPLVPIGDKSIIEIIMNKFSLYGVKKFYVSTHHRSAMIKAYFDEIETGYQIDFLKEKDPLGTAGCLCLLHDKIFTSIVVSNCDIIIDADYCEIAEYHESNGHDITIVGSFRHFTIPYGVCKIENGGRLVDIDEKPEYDFLVNTGMTIIRKDVLEFIPKDRPFDIPDLVRSVKEKGGAIGVFPIDEKSWIDVGQWEEYRAARRMLEHTL